MPFTNGASYKANNCVAVDGTNGVDVYATTNSIPQKLRKRALRSPGEFISKSFDVAPSSDIALPPPNVPGGALNESLGVAGFFMLSDRKTGALALGSFEEDEFAPFLNTLFTGLQALKAQGATRLIVDVVSTRKASTFAMLLNAYGIVQ